MDQEKLLVATLATVAGLPLLRWALGQLWERVVLRQGTAPAEETPTAVLKQLERIGDRLEELSRQVAEGNVERAALAEAVAGLRRDMDDLLGRTPAPRGLAKLLGARRRKRGEGD